ncbi:MAG TPA: AAA family ATPase [Pseudonocardiaceae bacterium]|nr:AAA family ATPase [Pseudonocardiaceae bacterium]
MAAILITGMSGTGKSTVLGALAEKGFPTVDTDFGDWIEQSTGERLWRVDAMDALLAEPREVPLFVAGTVANQGRFYPRFAEIVLLHAPLPVMLARIAARTGNPFGRTEEERARIIADTEAIEPLLRARATVQIDTTAPLNQTIVRLARLAAG